MTKMNYNRPNGGYEREPWHKSFKEATPKKHIQKQNKNELIKLCNNFISGKYWNQSISQIIKKDPNYIIWVLENHPTGIVAKQIIRHYNR